MGEVFRAVDRASGRDVAVKILLEAVTQAPAFAPLGTSALGAPVARFAREAEVLEELSHPGIVRYVAHGVTASGQPYLAMEWLDGEDLKDRLRRADLSLGPVS
jgi:serine/threonine protein kinase